MPWRAEDGDHVRPFRKRHPHRLPRTEETGCRKYARVRLGFPRGAEDVSRFGDGRSHV
jgi:hypothetical protein